MKAKETCIIADKPWVMESAGDWCKKHKRPLILCELEVLRGMAVYMQGVLRRNAASTDETVMATHMLEELEDFRSLRVKAETPTQVSGGPSNRVCIRMTERDMERLKARADREGLLISDVLRKAIRIHLAKPPKVR